jgi:hypothetical protein
VIAYNLYLMSTYSMRHAKRFKSAIERRTFFDAEPFIVSRDWFVRGIHLKQPRPRPYMYAPFPPSCFKTFLMRMPNGKLGLGSSWIDLSKLVSRRESHTSMCGRTLSLGSRDKNSGPRVTRMSQTTTSQCGGSSKPFSMFKHTILIIPHHLVILDSFVALIQQLNRSE